MAPVKRQATRKLRTTEARTASSVIKAPNINLPECAQKILNKELVIEVLPTTTSGKPKRTLYKMDCASRCSRVVKSNSAPNMIRTYSKMKPNHELSIQPVGTWAIKQADNGSTVKKPGEYPSPVLKAITLKKVTPMEYQQLVKLPGANVKNNAKQPVEQTLTATHQNQGQSSNLPVIQLSKLPYIKPLPKAGQPLICSRSTDYKRVDLLCKQILKAHWPANSKLSIAKSPPPKSELSVTRLSKVGGTTSNPCGLPSQLNISSLVQMAVAKPGSTKMPQTCHSTPVLEKLLANKLNPQLSIISMPNQEPPSTSSSKKINNPILRERKNVEANRALISLVHNSVESPQEEIIIISDDSSPEDDDHLNSKEAGLPIRNDRKRRLSTKQPQLKEKSAKLVKPNDENVVPLATELKVEASESEPPKPLPKVMKRHRNIKQSNFSSVMPETKKLEMLPTSDTNVGVPSSVQILKSKMPVKISSDQILEVDSTDPGFQMLDIDLFFASHEFEIPDMDILMRNYTANVKNT